MKINVTETYEKLHAEYVLLLVDYHNKHLKFIKGNHTQHDASALKKALKKIKAHSQILYKEIFEIQRIRRESHKNFYVEQRTRHKKEEPNDNNN